MIGCDASAGPSTGAMGSNEDDVCDAEPTALEPIDWDDAEGDEIPLESVEADCDCLCEDPEPEPTPTITKGVGADDADRSASDARQAVQIGLCTDDVVIVLRNYYRFSRVILRFSAYGQASWWDPMGPFTSGQARARPERSAKVRLPGFGPLDLLKMKVWLEKDFGQFQETPYFAYLMDKPGRICGHTWVVVVAVSNPFSGGWIQ
jgi:hypothetical protein